MPSMSTEHVAVQSQIHLHRSIGVFRAKGTIFKHERTAIALGADVRVPTGDEKNFLGTGAAGVKPFLSASITLGYLPMPTSVTSSTAIRFWRGALSLGARGIFRISFSIRAGLTPGSLRS